MYAACGGCGRQELRKQHWSSSRPPRCTISTSWWVQGVCVHPLFLDPLMLKNIQSHSDVRLRGSPGHPFFQHPLSCLLGSCTSTYDVPLHVPPHVPLLVMVLHVWVLVCHGHPLCADAGVGCEQVRAGEGESEAENYVLTNPVAKTSMSSGLSQRGKAQVHSRHLEH